MSALRDINWKKVIGVNLIFGLLFFLPYFPIAFYLHDFSLLLSEYLTMMGLLSFCLFLPAIVLWLIIFSILNASKNYSIKKVYFSTFWVTFYTLPITFFISSVILATGLVQNFGISITIAEGKQIVKALENYKIDYESYPVFMEELTPKYLKKIPRKKFPAISDFRYKNLNDNFHLEFTLKNSIFESLHIEYNPKSSRNIYEYDFRETGYPLWKYYVQYEEYIIP